MEKLEKIKKIIKQAKVVKRVGERFTSYVVEVELINGKKFDARIKSYDMENLVDEIGADNFKVTFETRTSAEKKVDFNTFVVSCSEAEYETFAFPSKENMALMNLLANKQK